MARGVAGVLVRSVREARLTGTAAGGVRERLGRGEAARRRGECACGACCGTAHLRAGKALGTTGRAAGGERLR